jgi:hypothetical protein
MPSQLLKCAPDMAALDLDLKTSLANECEPSHIVNLRGSLKPISSVKWKRDSWMSHLYGTILKPSHTNRFTDWWTSSLRDTLANRSQPPENEQGKKTPDTSGLGSQMEFDFFNQECASSKMSKATSPSDSERSLESWNQSVTKARGEYSRRLKSGRLTSASGSSSWPTIRASEYKDTWPIGSKSHDHMLGKGYLCAVVTQDAWQTPTTNMDMVRSEEGVQKRIAFRASIGRKSIPDGNLGEQMQRLHGQAAPANPSTDGSRPELWATPRSAMASMHPEYGEHWNDKRGGESIATQVWKEEQWATPQAHDAQGPKTPEQIEAMRAKGHGVKNLNEQACWGTPTARDHKSGRGNEEREYKELTPMVERTQAGKLNPRWVETLQGVCMGWTSPSCPASVIQNWPKFVSGWCAVTIEQTSCDSSATESCLPPQSEHSELFGRNSND